MFGCVTFQIQSDPLKLIADTLKSLSRQIGYFQDPKDRITLMTDAMDQLRAKRKDLENRIRQAQHAREVPTYEFLDWLGKVGVMDEKVNRILDKHEKGRFRWCTNRRAANILPDVMALYENFVDNHRHDLTIRLLTSGAEEIPAELQDQNFVLDTYLSQLKDVVEDGESRIIGIWGMGGIGKTTLLSSLNKYLVGQRLQIFEHLIWPVASKDHSLVNLQRDITKLLGLSLCEDTVTQAREIRNFLKNKTFLLLLDDLWNPIDLAELGIPLTLSCTTSTKQKVVFTTRELTVCGQMQARPKIKIECLKEAEAWQLFQNKVGEETLQAHERIPQLARQVVKECDGLPLAIVMIGSTMSMKKTIWEWQDAITLLQSRPHEVFGVVERIYFKLKFSYDKLANEILRKCFLLCSLWPEDHLISKINLIECWIGHGLIDEHKFDNIIKAYDNGHSFICWLQAACLLEPGDNIEREVKMHDMVRNLARWIASDCGKKLNTFIFRSSVIISEDLQTEVKRISLVKSDISDTSFLPANCSALETLMLQESNSFKSIMPGFFKGAHTLIYLDLSNTEICNLPEEISLLVNLRYLNLSKTKISSLPLNISCLCKLRFLLLRELHSIVLPCGVMEKLVMLSVIDMTDTWCNNWNELSKVSGYLKRVGIVLESIEDLHQLAQLSKVLTWRLGLRKLLEFNEPLQLLSASQLGSPNIRSSIQMLKIESCERLQLVLMEIDGGSDIQQQSLLRLDELELKSLPELKEFVWRGVYPAKILPSLTVLTIYDCHNLSNISWVLRLPSLEVLTVSHCTNVQQIIYDYSELPHSDDVENGMGMEGRAFPSLRRIYWREMNSLSVFGGTFTMPSLELLQVIGCPKMKTLPFGMEIVKLKLKEIRGMTEWWEELEMEENVRATLMPCFQDLLGSAII